MQPATIRQKQVQQHINGPNTHITSPPFGQLHIVRNFGCRVARYTSLCLLRFAFNGFDQQQANKRPHIIRSVP